MRDQRFRALIDYIKGLPAASRYRQALLDDERTAALIVEHESKDEDESTQAAKYAVPISEWNATTILLSMLYQGQEQLIQAVGAPHGSKYTPKQPPTPVTAVDKARAEKRRREVDRLFDLFTAK